MTKLRNALAGLGVIAALSLGGAALAQAGSPGASAPDAATPVPTASANRPAAASRSAPPAQSDAARSGEPGGEHADVADEAIPAGPDGVRRRRSSG